MTSTCTGSGAIASGSRSAAMPAAGTRAGSPAARACSGPVGASTGTVSVAIRAAVGTSSRRSTDVA